MGFQLTLCFLRVLSPQMITHNNEFVRCRAFFFFSLLLTPIFQSSALCQEKWTVENGILTAEGGNAAAREKIEWKPEAEEFTDALGNTIKIKKKLTKKEEKQKAKDRKARIARGEDVSDEEA